MKNTICAFDVNAIRKDFPILKQMVNGSSLAYLDNAATTQKPKCVIDAITDYYVNYNSNVHRGVHALSAKATDAFEYARKKVAQYIHANEVRECIFVRGTTEGINLVANAYVGPILTPGDEILITAMEHHSNIVPWQHICKKYGAILKVIPITNKGELDLTAMQNLISHKTKLLAITYASNVLGTINEIKNIVKMAHRVGCHVLVDGAQALPHLEINVKDLDCDFFVFSGHKVFAPTGIGVLYGKAALLEKMDIYQGGGEMITTVSFEKTEYAPIPAKFEAGTPNISGAIALANALSYLEKLDWKAIQEHEHFLLTYAEEKINELEKFTIYGQAKNKVAVISFAHRTIHAHDIGTILDDSGVAIRTGHHCAMPLMDYFQVPAMNRISFSFYNTKDEIDRCIQALQKALFMLG